MTIEWLLAYTPGVWEILLVLLAMLLLFGKRLPEVGRSLGKGMVEFKRGLRSVEDEVHSVDVEVHRKQQQAPPQGLQDGSNNAGGGGTATGTAAPTNSGDKTPA